MLFYPNVIFFSSSIHTNKMRVIERKFGDNKKKKKITTAAVFTFLQAWGGFLRYSVMSMSGLPKSILSFV